MPHRRVSLLVVVVQLAACGGSTAPAPRATPPVVAMVPTSETPAPTCRFEPERATPPRRFAFGTKRRAKPDADGPTCQIADSNIEVAMDTVLGQPAPPRGPAHARWDRRTKPAHLDLVTQRFNLNADEQRRLARDGFVVPARLEQPSYGWAYHEIYQSQLPVYITVDSILNAVYAAHDGLLADLERRELEPRLRAMLATLHCTLPVAAARYPAEVARDLDLYLAVARTLLGGPTGSALGDHDTSKRAATLAATAVAAGPMRTESLFGRGRVIDWSQYQPRGHYAEDQQAYFRAVMWLSRIELNVVSRSSRSSQPGEVPDPRETPRETVVALALADLVETSGQADTLARFEQVFALFAGPREDIPLPALATLAKDAGVTDLRDPTAAEKTRGAVGHRYRRRARIHYMPEGATELPAIASFIGPRIVPDTIAVRQLAHGEVPHRQQLRGGDIAYLLGHDRGKAHLSADLAKHPELASQLDVARAELAKTPHTDDLYTAWLDALRAVAGTPKGTLPTFAKSDPYRDLKLNTTLAGFAQLRHNHVLIAGQAYGEGGCRIPDGFVEPAPAVFDALTRYAELGAEKMALFEGSADAERAYFLRLAKVSRTLATIARHELTNTPLPPTARGFLGMVSEMLPYGSDGRPTYTGWYFDLFHDRADAVAKPDLVADYFTSTRGVSYLGVQPPTLGVFVVDTGGGPRVFVGPVARAYEYHGPVSPRLDDVSARKLTDAQRVAPWAASYGVPRAPEPAFAAQFETEWGETWSRSQVTIETKATLGNVTVELRDHHRVKLAALTLRVGPGKTVFRFPKRTTDETAEAAIPEHVVFVAGSFFGERALSCSDGCLPMAFGSMRAQYEHAGPAEE